MIQINGNVQGQTSEPVEMVLDNGHRYPVAMAGSRLTVNLDQEPSPFGAHLEQQGRILAYLTVPPQGAWEADAPPVSMVPPRLAFGPPPTAKLETSGRDFLQHGARWLWKGATDFRLYQWFLQGRDITAVIDQRREAGANILRVLSMFNGGIGVFIPSQAPNYWEGWGDFLNQCAEAGMQVEVTAFADAQNILKETHDQIAHWQRLGPLLAGHPNVVVELVNEYPQNGVDPGHFTTLPGLLCARGSGLGDQAGYTPGWNYHTWHGRRDWPKVLFSSEDMWYVGEGYGPAGPGQYPIIPVVHDEPIGFDEVDQPGRRTCDPYVARVLGQSCSAFGCGGTAHSSAGIQSELWGPRTDACVRAFFAGVGG